jgi:hypothetical protein
MADGITDTDIVDTLLTLKLPTKAEREKPIHKGYYDALKLVRNIIASGRAAQENPDNG